MSYPQASRSFSFPRCMESSTGMKPLRITTATSPTIPTTIGETRSRIFGATISQRLFRKSFARKPAQNPITTVYDLLSESDYQAPFVWQKIQKAAVYHRVFKDVSGPDVLTRLAQVLAEGTTGFAQGSFRQGWYRVADNAEGFGLELKLGEDRFATREGDVDKVRSQLVEQQRWLNRLSKPLSEALVLAEASWRKVQDLPVYEWGGVAVSFIKPVERLLKDCRHLSGRETLGDVLHDIRTARGWTEIYPQVQQLNDLFIRGKHLAEPALSRTEVPTARSLTFEILRFGLEQARRESRSQ